MHPSEHIRLERSFCRANALYRREDKERLYSRFIERVLDHCFRFRIGVVQNRLYQSTTILLCPSHLVAAALPVVCDVPIVIQVA